MGPLVEVTTGGNMGVVIVIFVVVVIGGGHGSFHLLIAQIGIGSPQMLMFEKMFLITAFPIFL